MQQILNEISLNVKHFIKTSICKTTMKILKKYLNRNKYGSWKTITALTITLALCSTTNVNISNKTLSRWTCKHSNWIVFNRKYQNVWWFRHVMTSFQHINISFQKYLKVGWKVPQNVLTKYSSDSLSFNFFHNITFWWNKIQKSIHTCDHNFQKYLHPTCSKAARIGITFTYSTLSYWC